MKKHMFKNAEEVWKKMKVLGQKQGSITLRDLSLEMGLKEEETLAFLRELFPSGVGAQVYQQGEECWVDLSSESLQYMLPLSPTEWLKLHELLSSAESNHPVLSQLKKKVTENGPTRVMMELLKELEHWNSEVNEKEHKLARELDQTIEEKKVTHIATGTKNFIVFPCRVLHLEGNLTLIAEDVHDHCLMVIPLSEIKSFTCINGQHKSKVTSFEVEEFINAVRSMNEKETRLILKIHDPHSVNLFPDHHFLGKPCMITTSEGELIWAAYVEPCADLYEWVKSLGENVEILDPIKFRQDFLAYCEEKIRKVA